MSEQLCYATGPYSSRIFGRRSHRWQSIAHHLTEPAALKYIDGLPGRNRHHYAIFQATTKIWDSHVPTFNPRRPQ